MVVGKGRSPVRGHKVTVHYTLRLASGRKVDSSGNRPFTFRLGVGDVIKGWDLGVVGMKVGGQRSLVVPGKLGYGARGAPPDIPPNATLCFDIQLLKCM